MRKFFLGLFLLLISPFSFAALHLELTQGISAALPIAIVPFAGSDSGAPTDVSTIISKDLQNSGRFKLQPAEAMQQQPSELSQVDFASWQKQGMDNVVIGKVTPVDGSRYQVSFILLSSFKGNAQNPDSAILLQEKFTVNRDQLRKLSHHVSDMIYQRLTGDSGMFSTRIAYIVTKYFRNKPPQYLLDVADYDGYNPRALVVSSQPIMSPSWSQDGRKLAYVALAKDHAAIHVVDVASGGQRLISDFPGINGAPAWSPNGQKLAIVLSKTGYPKIYTYNLANSQLAQITDGFSLDTEPRWSKDGESIIFTSNRGGGPQIYKTNVNTRQTQRLTFDGNYNATASFTPHDQSLVVLHGGSGGYNIAVQELSSGALSVITHDGNASSPSIAPNGQMVIYATNAGGVSQLSMVSIDGKIKLRLPTPEGSVKEPSWSPNLG
jgi:TolB protein